MCLLFHGNGKFFVTSCPARNLVASFCFSVLPGQVFPAQRSDACSKGLRLLSKQEQPSRMQQGVASLRAAADYFSVPKCKMRKNRRFCPLKLDDKLFCVEANFCKFAIVIVFCSITESANYQRLASFFFKSKNFVVSCAVETFHRASINT